MPKTIMENLPSQSSKDYKLAIWIPKQMVYRTFLKCLCKNTFLTGITNLKTHYIKTQI